MRPIAFKNTSKVLKAGILGLSFFWYEQMLHVICEKFIYISYGSDGERIHVTASI